jgi:hypothetical protein
MNTMDIEAIRDYLLAEEIKKIVSSASDSSVNEEIEKRSKEIEAMSDKELLEQIKINLYV